MAAHQDARPAAMHGLMAEFDTADALVKAARAVTAAGYRKTDAFSPLPIHEIFDAMKINERKVPKIILAGGIAGLLTGIGLQYWTQVIAYPMNIGGRPLASWVAWIPPAFETTILFSVFAAVFGMLALNGLPRPYHPVFNAPRFSRASQDGYFLLIETADPKFDAQATKDFLQGLHPREVVAVEE
jgi:hypothetical protein